MSTIASISTAPGIGGIGIIRMSGEKSFEVLDKIFVAKNKQNIDEIIYRSLLIKKSIVEEDEKETGIRKILNFGHTIGHAYESYYGLKDYYHGECVGMGMI